MADPSFNQVGQIDMLLGADVYSSLLYNRVNTLRSPDRQLIAQQTVLGWLVSGPANRKGNESMSFVVSNIVEVGTRTC